MAWCATRFPPLQAIESLLHFDLLSKTEWNPFVLLQQLGERGGQWSLRTLDRLALALNISADKITTRMRIANVSLVCTPQSF